MTIASKLALLQQTKQTQKELLGVPDGVPFSQYYKYMRPKAAIKADFVNQTYTKDGKASTFAEMFEFNRAGKAWLVKSDGLQEFAANEPRFDKGLLIEQASTNLTAINSASAALVGLTTEGVTYKESSSDGYHYIGTTDVSVIVNEIYTISATVKNQGINRIGLSQTLGGNRSLFLDMSTGTTSEIYLEYGHQKIKIGDVYRISAAFKSGLSGAGRGARIFATRLYGGTDVNSAQYKGDNISAVKVFNLQIERGGSCVKSNFDNNHASNTSR